MKALIYKDLLAVWKYCRTHIFMCAAFLLSSVFVEEYSFLQMYPLIFMGMLVNTLIAYDERDKWDRQVLTMPVTRKQMDIAMLVVLAVAAPSLILPFIFRNGSEKGRLAYLIVFGTLFALVAAGGVVLDKLGMVVELTELPVGIISMVTAVVLYPASWGLSVHWYGKREF